MPVSEAQSQGLRDRNPAVAPTPAVCWVCTGRKLEPGGRAGIKPRSCKVRCRHLSYLVKCPLLNLFLNSNFPCFCSTLIHYTGYAPYNLFKLKIKSMNYKTHLALEFANKESWACIIPSLPKHRNLIQKNTR